MPDLALRIEGATYHSNNSNDPRGWRLRVVDAASSVTVAEFSVSVEDAWTLITGGSAYTTGQVTNHPDRLGKKMRNWQVQVPTEVGTGYSKDGEEKAREWAGEQGHIYDTVEIRRTNHGLVAVYRIWEDA
jgi:hypothetical protein